MNTKLKHFSLLSLLVFTPVLYSRLALAHSPTPHIPSFVECDISIDASKELVITDPLVVENVRADPGGPWHFASLFREMLPASHTNQDLSDFMLRWFKASKVSTQLNGFELMFPGLALWDRTVCRWIEELGGHDCSSEKINPDRAPYKLVGIVSRLDLHGHGPDHAEGRFIFGALSGPTSHPATDLSVTATPETVIFEYSLPLTSEQDIHYWARAWHQLQSLSCTNDTDCEAYRKALNGLTSQFSARGLVAGKPNGNSLGQIRSSHLAPSSGDIWQFRQFELKGSGTQVNLNSVPLSQTPDGSMDNNISLAGLLNQNATAVIAENFILPLEFLGGESLVDDTKSKQWEMNLVDSKVRNAFSRQTCNGCHGELPTQDGFFHISPVSSGPKGVHRLSPFLKGELPNRALFVKSLLCR